MLSLDTIALCQKKGIDLMQTLADDEKTKIDAICEYISQQVIQAAIQAKAPVQKAVSDAFLYGIGLGLTLQIQGGELKER